MRNSRNHSKEWSGKDGNFTTDDGKPISRKDKVKTMNYETIISGWDKVWHFVGELLFYPTKIGGYMDGPKTLFWMVIISIISGYIVYRIITSEERRRKNAIRKFCSKSIIKNDLTVSQAEGFTYAIYKGCFPDGDKEDFNKFLFDVYVMCVDRK